MPELENRSPSTRLPLQAMLRLLVVTVAVTLLALVASQGVVQAVATTFTVNSANDADDATCDATHCSLREAINAANANAGTDTIAFNIPGDGPHTIQPTVRLAHHHRAGDNRRLHAAGGQCQHEPSRAGLKRGAED